MCKERLTGGGGRVQRPIWRIPLSSLVLVVFIAGCPDDAQTPEEGTTDVGTADAGIDTGAPTSCVDREGLGVSVSEHVVVLSLTADTVGPVALVQGETTGLALVGPDRERVALDSQSAEAADVATRADGTVCAVWRTASGTNYACGPGFVPTEVGIETAGRLHLVELREEAYLYYQTSGARTHAQRTGSTWQQVSTGDTGESYVDDALPLARGPATCAITSTGDLEVDVAGEIVTLVKAPPSRDLAWCRLGASDTDIWVLFGNGLITIPAMQDTDAIRLAHITRGSVASDTTTLLRRLEPEYTVALFESIPNILYLNANALQRVEVIDGNFEGSLAAGVPDALTASAPPFAVVEGGGLHWGVFGSNRFEDNYQVFFSTVCTD